MSHSQPSHESGSSISSRRGAGRSSKTKQPSLDLVRLEDRVTPVVSPTGALSGFVYEDFGSGVAANDNNGLKNVSEAGIGGVTVTLVRTVDGTTTTIATRTTDPTGFYQFTGLTPGGGYRVIETQPTTYSDGKDTPGSPGGGTAPQDDTITAITVATGVVSVNNNFGELLGALSGFVYQDYGSGAAANDDNGSKDPNEAGIPGVTLTLVRTLNGTTTTVGTTTTDANGAYAFNRLLLEGSYEIRETQPAGYADGKDTPGTPGGGSAPQNDTITAVTLTADNRISPNNNFGELVPPPPPPPPARLSGFVYEDDDNDGIKDASEAPIAGVTVTLTGPNGLTRTTTTDATGAYAFADLVAGAYTVAETQPSAYLDGKDTAGSKGGGVTNDRIAAITLLAGDDSVNNNFGELKPARLSGFEYEDTDDDGVKDAGEAPIPGVTVTLTGTDDLGALVDRTATTATDGGYSFSNLRPGSYTVSAAQPPVYDDGKDTPGSKGGAVTNDRIAGIPLVAGDDSVNNNFGELVRILTGSLSGYVYEDFGSGTAANNDNGVKDAGERGIDGVTVTLVRVAGGTVIPVGTTTTDANGFYRFTGLLPTDGYRVVETQPAGYRDGKDTAGTTGGTVTNDQIDAVSVPPGGESFDNNFGELAPVVPPPAQLSGFVYVDTDDDGVKDASEAPIPGTTLTLVRTVGGTTTTVGTTTTDDNGFYQFLNLTPGGGYEVRQTQPAGYNDGKDTPGAPGGGTAPQNDTLTGITLAAGDNSVNNNFGELLPPPPPPPGTISGFVYVDTDNDGVKDSGETPIPGTTVTLTGPNGLTRTTTTDATGAYAFTDLAPGTYTVTETQPADFVDGKDTAGSKGGVVTNDRIADIVLVANDNSVNNNFGERTPSPPPPPANGSLSGFVYVDENDDGVKDAVEKPIAGVTVTLTGSGITRTTTTDANGFYRFADLPVGTYTVTETQPADFDDGKDTPGTKGGTLPANDVIAAIPVTAGQESPNNNFGEKQCFTLYGYVWFDQNQNGAFDPGELGLGGVPVTVGGTTATGRPLSTGLTGGQALTVFTDASGRYAFTCLPAGTYNVTQTNTPAGYQDFREQNAAPGLPVGGSTPTSFTAIGLDRDAPGPLNFGKIIPGSSTEEPGRPNPQRPATNSKQDFLSSSGVTAAPSQTSPLLTAPTVSLPLNPSYTNGGQATRYVVGTAGAGYLPVVRVFDYATGGEKFRFLAYGAEFTGGVAATAADVTGDGVDDIITAAGQGGGPHVKVFDGVTGAEIRSFFAYAPNFRGGVWVAAGDFDGDGRADIVTGAGEGGASHVRVWGSNGGLLRDFFAFDPSVAGGARVAVGDFNGDKKADIAAATGVGVAPQVTLFDGQSLAVLTRITAYETAFTGGVYLAAGDVDGDGRAEVITGAGQGGGPRVRVLTAATGAALYDFFTVDPSFTGGARVAARDVTGDGRAEVITGGGVGGFARVQVYSGTNLARLDDFYLFDSGVRTGVYVG
jgi:hypothetical protein